MKKELLDELKKEVERLNKSEPKTYNFEVVREIDEYYVIDHTDRSLYELWMMDPIRTICSKYNCWIFQIYIGKFLICGM